MVLANPPQATLAAAARILAALDPDRATVENGVGYNQSDGALGHYLSTIPADQWTPRLTWAAYKMLAKYQNTQLAPAGIVWSEIPVPTQPATEDKVRAVVVLADGTFGVIWPYGDRDAWPLKSQAGARWDRTAKAWTVQPTAKNVKALRAFATQPAFEWSAAAVAKAAVLETTATTATTPAGTGTATTATPPARTITLGADGWQVRSEKNWSIIEGIRALAKRRWDGDKGYWVVPVDHIGAMTQLAALGDKWGFTGVAAVRERIAAFTVHMTQQVNASRAADADLTVEGLGGTLRPFQRAGVAYALKAERTFLADPMGLGKTIQALATLQAGDGFPALIVCPASVKLNWVRETLTWLPGRSVSYLNGTGSPTTFTIKGQPVTVKVSDPNADIVIVNYDLLERWAEPVYSTVAKEHGKVVAMTGPVGQRNWKSVILDECHYIKNRTAKRSRIVMALGRQAKYKLALTGTPLLNRPSEFVNQLNWLGRLGDLGGFWTFMHRYCGVEQGRFGLKDGAPANLDELNAKLRALCYVRREKAEVLPELPPFQRSEMPVVLDNQAEYAKAEAQFISWLQEQATADAEYLASLEGLTGDELEAAVGAAVDEKLARARRNETLVRINYLRQLAAVGKLTAAREWVGDFLEENPTEKLIIFAHHRAVQAAMLARLNDLKVPTVRIAGEDSAAQRDAAIQAFQNDPNVRVIVCSLKAAREGITLTAASTVLCLELDWTPAALEQAEARAWRMGQQAAAVNAYYLLGEGSIDEPMSELLESKRTVIAAATDGNVVKDTGIMAALIGKLLGKGAK